MTSVTNSHVSCGSREAVVPAPRRQVDKRSFMDAMSQLAASVCLITTAYEGRRGGLTATGVISLTVEPPRILVSVNRAASAYPLICESGIFCINILSSQDRKLAEAFSSSDPTVRRQRFADPRWMVLNTGAPVLRGAIASVECEVDSAFEFGSHTAIAGLVRAVQFAPLGEDSPLVYYRRRYSDVICMPN